MKLGSRAAVAIASVLFAASRLYLLFGFQPDQSDMYLYVQYAWEDEIAQREGRPLYIFHTEQFDRARAHAEATGGSPPLPETRSIEYPPLALQAVLVPKWFAERPGEIQWNRHEWPLLGYMGGYERAFRAFLAAFDLLAFVVLLRVVPRLFPSEGAGPHLERWVTYIGGGHLLGHLLYDRLSLPPGVFLLVAVALLVFRRWPAALGLAALAAAVTFQLSPLVLAPLFVLGALPLSRLQAPLPTLGLAVALRAALFVFLVAALFVPFYLREGPESLAFLRYHGERGLQLESVAASVPLALSFFGHPMHLVGEFGAWHLRSSLAPALAKASPALILLLVGGVALLVFTRARRLRLEPMGDRLAVVESHLFAGAVIASLALAILASKVFSPQYLLWLLPLVPLTPARRLLPLFLAVAALTTAVFPYFYDDIAALQPHGKLLLIARNALFVVFAALTAVALRRAR